MRVHFITAFAIGKNRLDDGRQSSWAVAAHEYSCGGMAGARRRKRRSMISRAMLRIVFVVLAAISLCPLAHAQPSPARRVFEGRVLTDNGLPVGGATITLRRLGATSASFWGTVLYSDARGDFSVPDAEDGEYALSIEAGGMTRFGVNYTLSEKTAFLKTALDRLATISLRVLRPDGTPLASTPVSVLMRESTRGENATQRGTTDAAGTIAFPNATPGVVSMRVFAPRVGYGDLNDLKIAPGSRSAAVDARLQAGGTLRITARDAASVAPIATKSDATKPAAVEDATKSNVIKNGAGKVAAPRVVGSATVTITLASTDSSQFKGTTVAYVYDNANGNLVTRDGEGATEVKALAPGQYSISLSRINYGSPAVQNIEIKAGETASLDFEMKRAEQVSVGQVSLVAQGLKGQVLANRDLFIPMEMLAPNSDTVTAYSWRSARTDARGRIVLYPVEAGRWRITPRIAANSDAPATQTSPAAAPQITIVAPLAAPDPAALAFSFAAD